ncbi:MAG: hypothetical protein KC653_00655 [Candidatus Andersenbacteria bacterium]|nr:hypothetical protein [Candidatus Andersenbacteria bacterium]
MKLRKRGAVNIVGAVQLKETGRPEWIYSKRPIKPDWAEHEFYLTEFLMDFLEYEIVRGNDVDGDVLPDAEIIGKVRTYVELDMHTEGYEKIKSRMKKHLNHKNAVVWVCHSETRMKGLMKHAPNEMWFTVLGWGKWISSKGVEKVFKKC